MRRYFLKQLLAPSPTSYLSGRLLVSAGSMIQLANWYYHLVNADFLNFIPAGDT
ncbi:MAG: hypothetical protein M1483_05700 [Actinobacteria bacterium]|nr:hypothetical protein [Actinomycetota bacterium]